MDDNLLPVSRDDLVFDIEIALSKGAVLWPRKHMHGVDHPYRPMAREVLEHLEMGGRLVFHVFGALAEFERSLIVERTRAGLDAAKARGRVGGRPAALDDNAVAVAGALLRDSSIPIREVAKRVGVSRATLYSYFPGGRAARTINR